MSLVFPQGAGLTVMIPAYNEGEMVLRSIESVANAQYPRDRLELLVVDDEAMTTRGTRFRLRSRVYLIPSLPIDFHFATGSLLISVIRCTTRR